MSEISTDEFLKENLYANWIRNGFTAILAAVAIYVITYVENSRNSTTLRLFLKVIAIIILLIAIYMFLYAKKFEDSKQSSYLHYILTVLAILVLVAIIILD